MENLEELLFGGQTFSWKKEEDGVYSAVLDNKVKRIKTLEDAEKDKALRVYFDLDYDYKKAREEIKKKDPILKRAVNEIGEIRMLKQDEWTAVISSILTQNNNIKRITKLYFELSRAYGKEVEKGYFSFPTAKELERTNEKELRELGVGFRAPFILDALDKRDIFEKVKEMDFDSALTELQKVKGIGVKVASCALIFGYGRKEGFPLDVWMKRVMEKYYKGLDKSYFHPYEALSQQYLFSWIRKEEKEKNKKF